jgi:hypothetical protein
MDMRRGRVAAVTDLSQQLAAADARDRFGVSKDGLLLDLLAKEFVR